MASPRPPRRRGPRKPATGPPRAASGLGAPTPPQPCRLPARPSDPDRERSSRSRSNPAIAVCAAASPDPSALTTGDLLHQASPSAALALSLSSAHLAVPLQDLLAGLFLRSGAVMVLAAPSSVVLARIRTPAAGSIHSLHGSRRRRPQVSRRPQPSAPASPASSSIPAGLPLLQAGGRARRPYVDRALPRIDVPAWTAATPPAQPGFGPAPLPAFLSIAWAQPLW